MLRVVEYVGLAAGLERVVATLPSVVAHDRAGAHPVAALPPGVERRRADGVAGPAVVAILGQVDADATAVGEAHVAGRGSADATAADAARADGAAAPAVVG